MIELVSIALSLLPVFFFLTALVLLDSFKLIKLRSILQTILMGCFSAVLCFCLAKWILGRFILDLHFYSRYLAPIVEELLKACYLVYLFKTKKVGFMVDGAIYGFAIGTGFAFIENIDYLLSIQNPNLLLWIIRGLGTAVMHGGTMSIFAILSKIISERLNSERIAIFLPGLILAIVIHSFFNHFFVNPIITTITQLIILPVLMTIVFTRSEKTLRDWLEVGLDSDVRLLELITTGNISETKIGRYLQSLKTRFPGETVADMLCFLRVHLELAARAKGILLMQQAGFRIPFDAEIKEKFTELRYLEKSIGTTGKIALSPILHTSTRDLWQLYLVQD